MVKQRRSKTKATPDKAKLSKPTFTWTQIEACALGQEPGVRLKMPAGDLRFVFVVPPKEIDDLVHKINDTPEGAHATKRLLLMCPTIFSSAFEEVLAGRGQDFVPALRCLLDQHGRAARGNAKATKWLRRAIPTQQGGRRPAGLADEDIRAVYGMYKRYLLELEAAVLKLRPEELQPAQLTRRLRREWDPAVPTRLIRAAETLKVKHKPAAIEETHHTLKRRRPGLALSTVYSAIPSKA